MSKRMFHSAGHACRGLRHAFATERNLQLFGAGYMLLLLLAGFLRVHAGEWMALLLAGGLFFVSEILNTALERFADAFHDHLGSAHAHDASDVMRRVKDVAAAASLVSLLVVALVAFLIVAPRLLAAGARAFP